MILNLIVRITVWTLKDSIDGYFPLGYVMYQEIATIATKILKVASGISFQQGSIIVLVRVNFFPVYPPRSLRRFWYYSTLNFNHTLLISISFILHTISSFELYASSVSLSKHRTWSLLTY